MGKKQTDDNIVTGMERTNFFLKKKAERERKKIFFKEGGRGKKICLRKLIK